MNRSLAFLFIPLFLFGCGVEAARPALKPPRATPEPPLSTLSVTLAIPQSDLARVLNAKNAEQIADLKDQDVKCPLGRCRLDLIAFRTGLAEISAEEGRLAIRVPFRLHAVLTARGFLSFAKAEGDAQGEAVATTALSLEKDWTLHSALSGRITLSNAHLRIGPLITNVAELWDENGESLSKPMWRMLDGEIARIQLKPQVETLWTRAFTPIAVGKKPLSWLVLRPEHIALMQPEIGHGALTLSLTVAARSEILVQDQMPSNPPYPLPEPASLSKASDRFSIAVPFLLPYAQAEQLVFSSFQRKPPRIAGFRLDFSSLHILPSDRDVVVETRFCAVPNWDITGWFAPCAHVYLRGRPRFDPASGIMRVSDLHYDLASASPMLRVFHAFASQNVTDLIGRHLVFDESKNIARLENEVRAELAKPHGQTLLISADVESFGTPSFSWTQDGFRALFSATGRVGTAFKL